MSLTTQEVLDVLTAARDLIADAKHWTRGAFARDSLGGSQHERSKSAICWCAEGALRREFAQQRGNLDDFQTLMTSMYQRMGIHYCNLIAFNDMYSHTEVLAAFDTAIAKLRAELAPVPT